MSYRVRLTYDWDGGDPLPPDELRLDLDLYRPLRVIERKTVHDLSETLDAIHGQLEKWTAGLDGGLLVLSPEDLRRRDEEVRAWVEEQRREAAEQQAAADDEAPGTAEPSG